VNMFVPGLQVRGPDDFHLIMPSILWSMALELVVIAAIWLKYREKAQPFLLAGAFIVAQMVAMGLMGDLPVFKAALTIIGNAPSILVFGTGFAIGALTSWVGWQAGKRPAVPVSGAVQPV